MTPHETFVLEYLAEHGPTPLFYWDRVVADGLRKTGRVKRERIAGRVSWHYSLSERERQDAAEGKVSK